MRLTLVIHSLGSGGAERVMATLANAWARRGWPVTLFTLDDGREPPFYPIEPAVVLRRLGLAGVSPTPLHAVVNNLRRLRRLRQAIAASQPDVVVSFMESTNVLVLLASAGLRTPVVVSERNDPAQHRLGLPWVMLRRWVYRRASRIVVQTERAAAYFPASLRSRAVVVPNPVVAPRGGDGGYDPPAAGQVTLAAGRLVPQKGFDLLLDAFAQVAGRHPTWRLVIWGDGPERAALEARRGALGLDGRVGLPGRTERLGEEMAAADLFVLSSRYEGFPNVLVEAMAAGLPVVAFDCPSGPREIVRSGIDGLLVAPADAAALAAALDRLLGDPAARRCLAARAPAVVDRFGLERVLAIWDDVFEEART